MTQNFEQSKSELDEISEYSKKVASENSQLKVQLEEQELLAAELNKAKVQLSADVGEYRQAAEEEQAQKTVLAGQLKLLQRELCLFKGQLEEEESKRNDTQHLLARTSAELQRLKLKCKCDSAAYVEAELMEQMKRKLGTKLAESQSELARSQTKGEEVEKSRQKAVKEMRELQSVNEELKENIVYLGRGFEYSQFD